jgi:hypothetical protein
MIISLLFPFSLLLCIAIPSHILMANSILAAFELSKPEERLRYAVSKAKSQEKKNHLSLEALLKCSAQRNFHAFLKARRVRK